MVWFSNSERKPFVMITSVTCMHMHFTNTQELPSSQSKGCKSQCQIYTTTKKCRFYALQYIIYQGKINSWNTFFYYYWINYKEYWPELFQNTHLALLTYLFAAMVTHSVKFHRQGQEEYVGIRLKNWVWCTVHCSLFEYDLG